MDIDAEILARIHAAQAWDSGSKLEDFQIRATAVGYILTNLKAGYSEFIFDESNALDDVTQVFPGIFSCEFAGKASGRPSKSSGNIITIWLSPNV